MILINKRISNVCLIVFLSLSILLMPVIDSYSALFAQTTGKYANVLKKAEDSYIQGNFEYAIKILEAVLNKTDVTDEEKKQAYKILGLTYIAKDYEQEARKAIRNLLEIVPEYRPDPNERLETFAELVEEVKKDMQKEKYKPVKHTETRPETLDKKWYWIGGGTLAVIVVVAILVSNGNGDEDSLPGPPSVPDNN